MVARATRRSTPGIHLIAPDFIPSIPRHAESLAYFLDEIQHPLLVGHSFGGAVATQLALTNPERFPAILLLSPAPITGLRTPTYVYPLLKSYRHDRRGLRRTLRRTMRTRASPFLDDLADEARMMYPAGFTGNARALSRWDVAAKARYYEKPVIVASGGRDTLVPPSSARATARASPDGECANLGHTGHSPQIETPNLVRRLLSRLLDAAEHSTQHSGHRARIFTRAC